MTYNSVSGYRPEPAWLTEAAHSLARVFADQGFAATRMEDLVAASGVPRATLYYHFRGKEAVLGWLMRSTTEQLAARLEQVAGRPGTGRERLVAAVGAMLATIGDHPDECRVLIGNLEGAGRLVDTAQSLIAVIHPPLTALLRAGAEDGSLNEVADPTAVCAALFGAVVISALQALIVQGEPDLDALGQSLSAVLIEGLGRR